MNVVVWDGDAKLKKQVTIEMEQDLLSNVTGNCKAECRISKNLEPAKMISPLNFHYKRFLTFGSYLKSHVQYYVPYITCTMLL